LQQVKESYKRAVHIWKETYKRDLHIWQETYKRHLHIWKETYQREVCLQRKRTYVPKGRFYVQKRPVDLERDI